jgi:PAS domain S-box-containing protein
VNAPYDRERHPRLSKLLSLRPEHWRSDLLTGVLRVVLVLGTVVCIPSVYMALREGLYVVAAGDTLALIAVAALLFAKGIAHRPRALSFCATLYLVGAMLLALVGPVSQIYLLGFSVMTTTLLGLRAGVATLAVNALTLLAFGYLGLHSPGFVPPRWIGDATGWGVLSLNFLLVNAALVVAVGAVLQTLESGLKRAAEQAALVEQAQDAIMVGDLEGRLRFLNPRAEALYGWDRDSALGQDVRSLQGASDPESYARAAAATLRDGTWSGELSQVTRGKDAVLVEARWTLLRRESGEPYAILAINTDITERTRLERHLMRAQRVESIGTLAGGIAHDLNNVLTPILTSIAFLKEGETDPEKLEDLAILDGSARRGADMVRQLLMFARGSDEGTRVVVQVGALARDVLKMVQDTFPKQVTAELSCAETPWPVRADPTQIHQLLMNLCVNARDAMPNGGTLTVGVEEVVIDEVYAGMTLNSKPGPYVLVRVEDTGAGMSKEVQDRIFEPFFTTKDVGPGDRPRALDLPHDRARPRRIHPRLLRGRYGHALQDLPARRRLDRDGRASDERACGAPARRRRDHPDRGRRGERPEGDLSHPRAVRVPGCSRRRTERRLSCSTPSTRTRSPSCSPTCPCRFWTGPRPSRLSGS